jgi:purine catabolism regulator
MMIASLKQLLQAEIFTDAKVLAGENGLNNKVTSINVLDAPDGYGFMKPGTLVVTNAYDWLEDEEDQSNLVLRLKENNVAGMGMMLRYLGGNISKRMKNVADQHDFPIIALDDKLIYNDLINFFNESVYVSQLDQFLTKDQIQKQLIDCYQDNFYPCILEKFHKYVNKGIYARFEGEDYLFGNGKNIASMIDNIKNEMIRDKERHEVPMGFDCIRSEMEIAGEKELVLNYAHRGWEENWFKLFLEKGSKLSSNEYWIIKQICSLIDAEIKRKTALSLKKKEQNISRLLTSQFGSYEDAQSIINEDGLILPPSASVLTINRRLTMEEIQALHALASTDAISSRPSSFVGGNYGQNFILLLPEQDIDNDTTEKMVQELVESMPSLKDISVGQGDVIEFMSIKESMAQSLQALFWAKKMKKSNYMAYGTLGFMTLIKEEDFNIEAEAFSRKYLEPLKQYDIKKEGELIKTLSVLIKNNWYSNQAAKILYVHHNTVKYRIEKIEKILDIDLNQHSNRLNVMIAIELYELYDF